jgi:Transposase domain (DUF772)
MSRRHGNRQGELFPRTKRPLVEIDPHHPLVRMADELDWDELMALVEKIRRGMHKNGAGRPPHLRALIGAVLLMGTRRMPYRDAEDQIRHYAPARYLCGLEDSDWTPDFTTIQEFTQLLGEEGVKLLNEYVVKVAVKKDLADPKILVADTTAQEAAIPYPNEIGLMASFLRSAVGTMRKAGGALKKVVEKTRGVVKAAKEKVRRYRLFAKVKKTKDAVTKQLMQLVEKVTREIGRALPTTPLTFAETKVARLAETMGRLIPQIRHWLRTGHVASGKIINLQIPELYSIVRGKVGKPVEFGLMWGISRLGGGFLLGTMGRTRKQCDDSKYVIQAVEDHRALHGSAPHSYAYDRGGYSRENVAALRKLRVRNVGLAPRGSAEWPVRGKTKERLTRERALVEGGIGAVKSLRYGFHHPGARSMEMMGACGQRGLLGFNLNKLMRELPPRRRRRARAG